MLKEPKLVLQYFAFRFFNESHNDYKRFIIISQSRAGSSLLVSLLQSNPYIDVKEEVMRKLYNKKPEEALENYFSTPKPLYIKSRGFKLFYYHPLDGNNQEMWQQVRDLKKVSIIHLKRKNLLRTITSRKLAFETGIWKSEIKKSHDNDEQIKVNFDINELEKEFNKIKKWEENTEDMFSAIPVKPVYYEDLDENRNQTIQSVCNFLEVDYFKPYTRLKKQNPEPLSELIANYHELKKSFRNSKWQHYFEN